MNRISRFVAIAVVGLPLLCHVGCNGSRRPVDPSQSAEREGPAEERLESQAAGLEAIKELARRGDYRGAERELQNWLVEHSADPEALELGGDLAVASQRPDEAIELYLSAIEQTTVPTAQLLDKLGRQWMSVGRPFEAIDVLESIVRRYPDDAKARADLAGLLAALGLEFRAAPHLRYLVQHGHAGPNELVMLTDLTRPQTDVAICDYALQRHPDDLRPKYAKARLLASQGKWPEALEDFQLVAQRHNDFVEAWAYWGRALQETNRGQASARAWADELPDGIEDHPQYWIAAGMASTERGDLEAATRAYWRAAHLDENDGEALSRLAGGLARLQRTEESRRVAARAASINAMRDDVESFFFWRNNSQRAAVRIAKSMRRLGRIWEAAAWARSAVSMTQDPADQSAADLFRQIRSQMSGSTPWQLADHLVTESIDVSELSPGVAWRSNESQLSAESSSPLASSVHFQDEASRRGLNHTCAIDKPPGRESGLYIYQSGAGGAGVIDFDLDGWPDFYLTACDGTPRDEDSQPNQLFRSLNGKYVNVTEYSGSGDRGYAQGVAAGDFNSDGFPDLLVANFGRNRLLKNNGDGTFTDISDRSGVTGEPWTTSVAIADLNEDGLADLFEANYVGGEDVITRKCFPEGASEHRSCGPLVFPAEADRVWRGNADGTFAEATKSWMASPQPGRGLGLVVGMLDDRDGVDVYVANDMTANQFWTASSSGSSAFRLEDQAAVRGVAFNERSLSQASMGIAADDADGDGDIDLYVTNFYDDYNTLYQQVDDGLWADRTVPAALASPTFPMLAYGTQWIDADNDGWLELMVANGNVDDFTGSGHAYRMPMQVFGRDREGRYQPLLAHSLGPYFETSRLGRALVTVDVDRDFRADALVTHLFDPVALLMNRSSRSAVGSDPSGGKEVEMGNAMFIQLIGTRSHRDAIGAAVTAEFGDQNQTRHLLAGNGYQSSCERVLRFGLGTAERIDRVTVRWPNGEQQVATGLEANRSYQWIQGQANPHSVSGP